jgi:signal-transduction protein with cAMP-binding, CBS, and nucleotidyltransferase domain
MHKQSRTRDEQVPEFDMEKTLHLLRVVRDVSARDSDTVNFWTALSPGEQGDIVSAAHKQTFPVGAVLMREGEHADNVMVILTGLTKICVEENGHERVIAFRGPGDLVGEHGAAPGGVRSATVVAAEEVLALVIRTGDFAAFIAEHPGLPDLVKQHVYDR